MIAALAAMSLLAVDMQPIVTFQRPDPPRTERQREEDDANRVTEGERAGDGATPNRLICDLRRVPGSNLRERVCQTVSDRRATRDQARETMTEAQRVYTDPPE
ncbi:MAG: hypothetical protein J0L52_00240 [Caulobacterales bacterium]|nr:hypothetical protein [Caulobacterales bacterium]